MNAAERNWGGNVAYRAARVVRPRTLDELAAVVSSGDRVAVVSTRHTFNTIGDADVLVDLSVLDRDPVMLDDDTVEVSGASRYVEVAQALESYGRALQNTASLPHVSVAGAVATGTHGSGADLGALGTAVTSLDLMTADGTVHTYGPDHPDLAGVIVNLGALGIVTALRLRTEPSYEVAQTVYDGLSWATLLERFDDVHASATSVSVFTRYGAEPGELWCKHRTDAPVAAPIPGITPASSDRHPIPGADGSACTAQHGVPGSWWQRLPHFRHDAVPSSGAEIQSEWFVERTHSAAAIEAMRDVAERIDDVLMVSEIRTVAADELWLSPCHGRDSTGFHFTWRLEPGAVARAVEVVHEALAPFGARLHWGKAMPDAYVATDGGYERLGDFRALKGRLDPAGVFTTPWFERRLAT